MDLETYFAGQLNNRPFPGLPDAWTCGLNPTEGETAAYSTDHKHVFRCYARSGFDEALVRDVILFAREHEPELLEALATSHVVIEGFHHEGYGFDILVGVGPSVHRSYLDEDAELHGRTVCVFPAFRCELGDNVTAEGFAYLYSRAPGIQSSVLDREPRPLVLERYKAATGRVIPERGISTSYGLIHPLRRLESQRVGEGFFVEYENYLSEVRRVEYDGERFVVEYAARQQTFDSADALLDFVKHTLYGPNLVSGDSEFTKNL